MARDGHLRVLQSRMLRMVRGNARLCCSCESRHTLGADVPLLTVVRRASKSRGDSRLGLQLPGRAPPSTMLAVRAYASGASG